MKEKTAHESRFEKAAFRTRRRPCEAPTGKNEFAVPLPGQLSKPRIERPNLTTSSFPMGKDGIFTSVPTSDEWYTGPKSMEWYRS